MRPNRVRVGRKIEETSMRTDSGEGRRALTVGRVAVLVPTSYSTLILSPPIVHLTLLLLSLFTSSHFSLTTLLR